MQHLRIFFQLLVSSSLVVGGTIQRRDMTAAQVVANINIITTQSQNLQPIVSEIPTGLSAFTNLQGNPFQGAIDGFSAIIQSATGDIQNMGGMQPFDDDDAQLVCTAFHNFVVVHQELLSIVIGKSGLLQSLLLSPVAAVLRALESVVDTLAFGLIAAVPFCAAGATADKNNLDASIGQAVCAYTPGGTIGVDILC